VTAHCPCASAPTGRAFCKTIFSEYVRSGYRLPGTLDSPVMQYGRARCRGACGRTATTERTEAQVDFPFVICSSGANSRLIDLIAGERDHILGRLHDCGAVLLRGFDAGGVDGFAAAVRALSGEPLAYTERSSPRSVVKGHVYTSTDYPPTEEIFFHNETSYRTSWPMTLFFHCVQPPRERGATPLSDVRQVLETINPSVREEFRRRGWMLVRNFDAEFGLAWQEVFGTQDRDELMRYCQANAIDAEWKANGQLRTTSRRKAIYRHPQTNDEVWFNHAVFFHLSTLPVDAQEGLRELFAEEDLPSNTYFGDGEPIPDDVMEHIRTCYRDAAVRFDYREGDVLIVDNMLTAHGREPFTPPRQVVVAMTELTSLESMP
jgi:alpha-ketoglutarate-dependent taurine dioxygenase